MTESTIRAGSIAFVGFGEAAHAFLDGYHYVPRIDKELIDTYHDGIV